MIAAGFLLEVKIHLNVIDDSVCIAVAIVAWFYYNLPTALLQCSY